jgi:ribosomal protein S8E
MSLGVGILPTDSKTAQLPRSQVVRCVEHKTGGLVAVKIIRNKKRSHQQTLVEVNTLQKPKE